MLIASPPSGLNITANNLNLGNLSLDPELEIVLSFLIPMSEDYPDIRDWFHGKVSPGLLDGSRKLVKIERDNRLIGVGIAKNDNHEKKICTVRVLSDYANRGIGIRIFDELLEWLNTDQPHLTISEHKLPVFEKIFRWYGFQQTSKSKGRYVDNVFEIAYNEL